MGKFNLIPSPSLIYCCYLVQRIIISNPCVALALGFPSKYARTCNFSELLDVCMKYFVLVSPH